MKSFKKPLTMLTLTAAVVASGFVGTGLFRDAQFARAEQRVEMAREQLETVKDLSSAFNAVSQAVSPSVVKIDVRKTVRGVNVPGGLRRFFDRDGFPFPGMPDMPFGDRQRGRGGPDGENGGDPDAEGGETPPGFPDIPDLRQQGSGSGVIVEASDGKAWILTNNHVAGEAEKMEIILSDGRMIGDGRLLGTDPKTDLAVIEVKVDNVIPAKLGDSDTMKVGHWVLAFGSPLGYSGSMTHGIISAFNRTSNPSGGMGILGNGGYENFIQTDAPINPGNSGGPLVNIHGEVIGINTAIASQTRGWQGIGFAIPVNQAKPIYEALKSVGKVTRGWLGVQITDVARSRELAEQSGYDGATGIYVMSTFRNTPATGILEPGDVITSYDGQPIKDTRELREQVALAAPGTNVRLGIVREGEPREVTVKLGEQPADLLASTTGERGPAGSPRSRAAAATDALGMTLVDPNDRLLEQFGLDDVDGLDGAIVSRVDPRGPASRAGVRPGDVISRVGKTNVTSADEAREALDAAAKDKSVRLLITSREGTRIAFIERGEDDSE